MRKIFTIFVKYFVFKLKLMNMKISKKTVLFVCFYLIIGFKAQAQEEVIDSLKSSTEPAKSGLVLTADDFMKSDSVEEKRVKPKFKGKDANTFSKWVNSRIVYPKKALEKGTQGKVILRVTIDTAGNVADVHLVLGVSKELNEEAIRVVSSSPKWTPGYINDKPVNVIFTFPVNFQLQVQYSNPWDDKRNNPNPYRSSSVRYR